MLAPLYYVLIRLLNPVNGVDLTSEMQRTGAVLNDPISLQLNIGRMRSKDGYTFKVSYQQSVYRQVP